MTKNGRTHRRRTYTCEDCGKEFSSSDQLAHHRYYYKRKMKTAKQVKSEVTL